MFSVHSPICLHLNRIIFYVFRSFYCTSSWNSHNRYESIIQIWSNSPKERKQELLRFCCCNVIKFRNTCSINLPRFFSVITIRLLTATRRPCGLCTSKSDCMGQVFFFSLFFLNLSQTANFRFFQTERVWWIWRKVLQMDRKRCGKRRNCSSWAISPFPTVFSKDILQKRKTRACLGNC